MLVITNPDGTETPVTVVPWAGATELDLTGQKIGRWNVVGYAGPMSNWEGSAWVCRCLCGTVRIVRRSTLVSGKSKSCGCAGKDRMRTLNKKHGSCSRTNMTPEYSSWRAMNRRCYGHGDSAYKNYGARGIVVCESWRGSFASFYRDMGPRPDGCTLDRIDNNGNYEPSNCRWSDARTQSRNRRANRTVIRDDGAVFPSLAEAAESVGLKSTTVRSACTGKIKTAGGFRWRYADTNADRAVLARIKETSDEG